VSVAGPARYGDHVEGLVKEGSEGCEGVEEEGMCCVEGEVKRGMGSEAESECLLIIRQQLLCVSRVGHWGKEKKRKEIEEWRKKWREEETNIHP
jgi:hypothetical protein